MASLTTIAETLDGEQQQAVETMLSGKNVFLTGKAGTGKSRVIAAFKQLCQKRLVCLAPTGQAARQIGGSTIHSFFNFDLSPVPSPRQPLPEGFAQKLAATEVIIIDEISMVSSAMFSQIDLVLREVVGNDRPFGGIQIIGVGDFCQLPPVIKNQRVREFISNNFGGIYAFETPIWKKAEFTAIVLHHIHRQTDRRLEKILDAIRSGEPLEPTTEIVADRWLKHAPIEVDSNIDYLRLFNWICTDKNVKPRVFAPVALCQTREQVNYINDRALERLVIEQEFSFRAVITGVFPQSEFPVAENLRLKRGVRVVIVATLHFPDGSNCVNGDVGTAIDIFPDIRPMVRVRLDTGRVVDVGLYNWPRSEYQVVKDDDGKESIESMVTGSFTQIPLAISAALTIHRVQGMTLDCQTHITLGEKRCFCPWQLYVALSRVKSLEQVTLDRPVTEDDLLVEPRVLEFYRRIDFEYCSRDGFYFKYFDMW